MNQGKCPRCAKTVYSTESVTVGPPGKEQYFHKICLKCEHPGCVWKLEVGTYRYCDGKVYCAPHDPSKGSRYGGNVGTKINADSKEIGFILKQKSNPDFTSKEIRIK